MVENTTKHDSPLHKLFKMTILLIVLVFILLIYYFIYVEFFKARDDDKEYIFNLNFQKYVYLDIKVILDA
jgi:hypothetical protein